MTGDETPATIAPAPRLDQIDAELRAERLRLYRSNLRSALAGQGLMAVFLLVVLWDAVAHARLLAWLAGLALALLGRGLAHRTGSAGVVAPGTALWRLRLSLWSLGLVWGLAGLLLVPPELAAHQVFVCFVLAAMAAGTLTLTAFDAFAAMGFCLLALAPMCAGLLGSGHRADAAMAGMVMLFVVLLSLTSLRAQRNLRDTVVLRTADALRAEALLRNQARLQQLSAALTAKSEALAVTLDSMAQGILSIGADGRTNFYNQRLLELLDLPPALLATRPTMDDITRYQAAHGHFGDELNLMDDAARAAFSRWRSDAQAEFPPSYTRRTLAGRVLEIKSRYLPEGGIVRTFADVTPYFDTQQKLADSEAQARKLALVAAKTDNAVMITDALRRIEWVNEGFTRLTGYELDEVLGRTPADLLRGADTDAAEVARMDRQLRLERRTAGELLHHAKDGRPYWFAVETQAILDDAGQVRQYISIGRDISERRVAEQALRAARDDAQRASQAKSEFLSAMSHELRTPLNAILGFGQLLAADPAGVLPERQQAQVGEILRAGAHLLELINDVLDLARVEAGKQPIVVEPVALAGVLDGCLALMRPVAQERRLRLEAGPSLPCACVVAADRTRLKQVLLNLLSNAIKYNHDGGLVVLECVDEGNAVCISVRDTGPGLGPAQRERLFHAFDRLGAEAGPVEGAGIGLVLSKRMVELMHGRIGVDSEPGVGSTFWVRLPSAPAPNAAPEDDREAATTVPGALDAGGTNTVLYVEDNPVNLLLMEAMLEHEPGVRLITAQDPWLGLRLARSERPQLILLDIQLPGIDGFEVLRRLRGDGATRGIPVIAISANAMPSDLQQGLDAGFDDYLTKPLDLTRLRARVRRALQR